MPLQLAEVSIGSLSPPMVAMLAIVTFAYARRARKLGPAGHVVPRWRQVCFYASVAVLVLEPLSPLGTSDENSFLSHMLEHLVIGDLAALLMVLGITGPLIAPLLKLDLIAKLRVLTHPLVALPLWLLNLYVWHLPFMMEGAIGNDTVHVIQHLLFFGFGFNMWMPLFGPLPVPVWFNNVAKLLYIVVVRLAGVLLGNIFVFSGHVYYDSYVGADNIWGLGALADQSIAGAVMMAESTFVSFALFAWLFVKAARESDASQDLIDLAAEHGVELTGERSARAAAAGTTRLLRERIVRSETDDRPPPGGET
ncbi:MAG: cytochrome c oxidase assembly protein [Thermoleophilia bacterium]|nr:cytochrome c oxidase assembly protein [Thermoleophilia bacterium]